jgi:stearoyl-CoA desaturase (delta-9 desaturase)
MYFILCALVFVFAYGLNIMVITIGYHRGIAHQAVRLGPVLRRIVISGGNWITGLDPKAWVVMHRMHHIHSDTAEDPHSPRNVGIIGIGLEQLRSYERVIRGLGRGDERFTQHAEDLDFELNWLTRNNLWWLPYVVHGAVALGLWGAIGWLLGLAYFLGMMSHPVQGGMVNALGHAVGGRNFDTDDDSRNNLMVAWLIMGEGLQNNHHRFPRSAKFSYRSWEPDLGFVCCLALETLGFLQIDTAHLIPAPPWVVPTPTITPTNTLIRTSNPN